MQRTRLFPYGRICAVLPGLLALALTSICWGQADTLQTIHISPRKAPEKAAPAFAKPAGPKLAEPFNEADRSLRAGTRTFVKDVDLVLVPVTITDAWNRLVMGLHRDDFSLLENGKEQQIEYFSTQDAPISACVIFDTSASMKDKIDLARKAVEEFVIHSNPEDEFCLITFSDHPNFVVGFGDPVQNVIDKLALTQASGRTSLFDAIYMGVDELQHGHNPRKVLLILSDGEDNRSRYTASEITDLVMESDLQAYAIGIFEGWYPFSGPENTRGARLLRKMAEDTGGGSMILRDKNELEDAARVLNMRMRNEYVLGYRPSNGAEDGKWRDIEVRLNRPEDSPSLHIATKSGYYAPVR